MRLNKFIALATGISRRQADDAISEGRVTVNGEAAGLGLPVDESAVVMLDGQALKPKPFEYVVLNKPEGYVCSHKSQDEKPTIFELLPDELQNLKVAGRLDADSHGLVLLTNDGDFANKLMHPSFQKTKRYEVELDHELTEEHVKKINEGIILNDGSSKLEAKPIEKGYEVLMHEGRNRQIRRTFDAIGFTVINLYRTNLGPYSLDGIKEGRYATSEKKAL